ncbi:MULTISPECIES: GNAT family N-acetyltransferase [Exiguobacterium]|uniref:GNAT family N-acetyltransferase n=1 Tax=Exiguobacterium TaxID=33986 RepID=UPI0004946606|nr:MULTISPECIES: GNAT family protein [Exiguobacterium]HCD60030.1 N-acetyltransferase [Exiguobacterium sp.]
MNLPDTIETPRHLLRRWQDEDAAALYAYAKDPNVGPKAGWAPHASLEESQEVIGIFQASPGEYAVTDKETGEVIGSFGFHFNRRPDASITHDRQVEIGYVLAPNYWGEGRMPEIVESMLAFIFRELPIDVVWCGHFDFNDQSRRVVEKLGFTHVLDRPFVLERIDGRTLTSHVYNWTRKRYEAEYGIKNT